jgi:hypothetical protein
MTSSTHGYVGYVSTRDAKLRAPTGWREIKERNAEVGRIECDEVESGIAAGAAMTWRMTDNDVIGKKNRAHHIIKEKKSHSAD